jgi:hypothetical protein
MAKDKDTQKVKPKSAAVIAAEKLFSPFLKGHSFSSIDEIEIENQKRSEKRLIIRNPWGDSSLVLLLPKNTKNNTKVLSDALNNVYLPERLTAIWHEDSKELEIIYTAFKIEEIAQREFSFRYKSKEYSCEFAPSSSRLMEIARAFREHAVSVTEYRNLRSFWLYIASKEDSEKRDLFGLGEPTSFWIKNLSKWDEDKIIELLLHLNFYMGYYDSESPSIRIHPRKTEDPEFVPPPRFAAKQFPTAITAHGIDTHLLYYWQSSINSNPARSFIDCYRIIEYAAFSYIDSEKRTAIRRTLAVPHAIDNIEGTIDEVVHILKSFHKNFDNEKIDSFLIEKVRPSVLWNEIVRNRKVFETDRELEGGFVIPWLIKDKWNEKSFEDCGVTRFAEAIRKIRNALSHGRDQQSLSVITSTHKNLELLEPWASLIAVAANEVMIFGQIITVTRKGKKESVREESRENENAEY